jgi:phosphatidate cytidylyltransferase
MLRWRLLLGVTLSAAIALLCWLDFHASLLGIWLCPLAVVLSLAASQEVLWLLAARGLAPLPWAVYAGNLLIVASNIVPVLWPDNPLGTLGWPLAAFAISGLAVIVGEMRRYERPGAVMERLALGIFALFYVGVLLSFVSQLRLLGDGEWGIAAIASLVVVVKMCDIGAYTCGRLFGRHKMSPVLSPGKTIEGAIGGLLFAVAGAWLAFEWLAPQLIGASFGSRPAWTWIAFGLVVGAAGIAGDLAESLFKRDVGRKDSSPWMPGFGGVLDLLDSILFAAPVAYLCWLLGLVGPSP